jgi:hypothetical protein
LAILSLWPIAYCHRVLSLYVWVFASWSESKILKSGWDEHPKIISAIMFYTFGLDDFSMVMNLAMPELMMGD